MPFFLWLRLLAGQRLVTLARRHLGAAARDARREVRLPGVRPESVSLELAGRLTSPTRAARRNEEARRVREALDALPEADREILSLRHFEQLTGPEAARELGLSSDAAGKRYLRALDRLRRVLGSPGEDKGS